MTNEEVSKQKKKV